MNIIIGRGWTQSLGLIDDSFDDFYQLKRCIDICKIVLLHSIISKDIITSENKKFKQCREAVALYTHTHTLFKTFAIKALQLISDQ